MHTVEEVPKANHELQVDGCRPSERTAEGQDAVDVGEPLGGHGQVRHCNDAHSAPNRALADLGCNSHVTWRLTIV